VSVQFAVPSGRHAVAPPERRGLARDAVRLLVARPGQVRHLDFRALASQLEPGDLIIVNTSATLPAALSGTVAGRRTRVHVAGAPYRGDWVLEIRLPDGAGPDLTAAPGTVIDLDGGARAEFVTAHPDPTRRPSRLWRATVRNAGALPAYLATHGQPIRYGYVESSFPLADYQTVYAGEPGSSEMASAGRPITERTLVDLLARGVTITGLTLHAGVSSPELHEPPAPEPYAVPASTARLVNSARAAGGRVVAVGTTVVRALESVVEPWGEVRAGSGWTDLVLSGERPARVVNGLVTGLHDAQASHLDLLTAVAGVPLVQSAYSAAVEGDYLWHEFGDSMLFLP